MFVGHYAVSLALKSKDNKVSLGLLFIAVQFVDILFFPLTLAGIERFNLIENYTESTHFQLEFMPFTHSLVAAFFWALVVFLIFKTMRAAKFSKTINSALFLGVAVLSHWFLDLIVHTPDLPLLIEDSKKVGLGLWNNAILTYLLEAVILLLGLVFYMKNTKTNSELSKPNLSKYGMPLFILVLLLVNLVNIFGPFSSEDTETSVAITSIVAYFVFAGIAHWLDGKRVGLK